MPKKMATAEMLEIVLDSYDMLDNVDAFDDTEITRKYAKRMGILVC